MLWISVIFFPAIDLTHNSPKYYLYSVLPIILFSIFPTLIVIKFRLFSATNMTNSILLYIPFFHTWLDQIDSPNLYKAGLATNRGELPLLHFFFSTMGGSLLKSLLWGLIVLVQLHGYRGCFDKERMGLLEIKEFVRSSPNVTDHLLHSWVDDHKSDCCHWERVTCNSIIGHLTHFSLFGWLVSVTQFSVSIIHNSKMMEPIVKRLFGKSKTLFP